MPTTTERAGQVARHVHEEYAQGAERPLRGYLLVLGSYGLTVGAVAGAARLSGRSLPARIDAGDFALIAAGSHKLARLLSKDAVTSPLRAPFTRYERPAGDAELMEDVRGHGVRHAVGEMVSCPFCMDTWVSTVFISGMVFAPRLTRLVAATMASVAVSDVFQLAYDRLKTE